MKPYNRIRVSPLSSLTTMAASVVLLVQLNALPAMAAITKGASGTDLTAGVSWVGGVAPSAADVAAWTSSSLGTGLMLGSSVGWQGISLSSAVSDVSITGVGTLTIGVGGIDLSAAANNFTNSANLTLGPGNQVWGVASGKTLGLNTGTFTRGPGATLNIQGLGTVASSLAGFANDSSGGGGILGPWATMGSGAGTTYAALTAGKVASYTGGMSNTYSIPSSTTAATNYVITTAGTVTFGAATRTVNTLTLAVGATALTFGNSASQINLVANGILNSGTGLLTIAQGGTGASSGLMIGANNKRELVLNAASAPITISSRIIDNTAGAASITVVGSPANPVTFSGVNTYTGGTTLNAGNLTLSGSGTLGAAANALTINGGMLNLGGLSTPAAGVVTISGGAISNGTLTASTSFVANNVGPATVSAILAGSGVPLTKSGPGVLTLTNANTYDGLTTIQNGTVVVGGGGSLAGAVTVSAVSGNANLAGNGTVNGVVTLNASGSYKAGINLTNGVAETLKLAGGLTLNSGNILAFDVAGTGTSDQIAVTGAYSDSTAGAGTVVVKVNNIGIIGAATIDLFATSGSVDATRFTLGSSAPVGYSWSLQSSGPNLQLVITSSAPAVAYWNGGVDSKWSTADSSGRFNWATDNTGATSTGGKPGIGTAVTFSVDAVSAASTTLGGNFEIGSLTFDSASGVTIGGANTLTNDGGITVGSSAGATAINVGRYIAGADQIISNSSSSTLSISAPVSGAHLTINSSGSGVTTLAGNNTHAGTTVSSGTLALSGAGTLGSSSGTVNITGGTLDLGGTSRTNGAVTLAGGTIQNGTLAGTSFALQSGTEGSDAVLAGAGSVATKTTPDTLTLAGANTYGGGTILNAGQLNLNFGGSSSANSAVGTGPLTLSGGVIIDNTSGSDLTLLPNNPQIWNGNFSYAGSANNLNLGAGPVTLAASPNVTVSANTLTVGGNISGAFALTKKGTGALTLAGNNTFNGGVTVQTDAGTLNVGSATALGTGTLNMNIAGATLDNTSGTALTITNALTFSANFTFGGSSDLTISGPVNLGSFFPKTITTTAGTLTFSGVLSGTTAANALTIAGTGKVVLSGNNTYAKNTVVSAGVLNIQNNNALGLITNSPTVSVSDGAALQMQGGITTAAEALTLNGTGINNDGALRNIAGNNTYAGPVTLGDDVRINSDAGVLTLSSGTALAGSAALTVGGVGSTTISSPIGATITALTLDGSGILTLAGANTYTGNTTINAGSLACSTAGSATSAITVSSGATNGIVVASAGGAWTNTSSVTQNAGSVLAFDFGTFVPSTNHAPMQVASLTISSPVSLVVKGLTENFTVGQTNPLVSWTGTGPTATNVFASLVMPVRLKGHLQIAGNTLNLVVDSSTGPLSWNTGNGTWNTTTANWVDKTLAAATYIDGGDFVLFDDASGASGNPAVTLNSQFSPGGVTVNSASHNYTLSGAGGIGGIGALAVQLGTLTLATSNSYTGGTTVAGGRLQISGNGTLGAASGALTIAGGTVDLGATSQTSGVVTVFSGVLTNGTLTGTSFTVTNTGAVTVGAGLAGAGALTKMGNGTLTLAGANTFTGGTTISNGTLTLNGSGTLGASTNALTVAGGILDLHGLNTPAAGVVTISNGTITNGTLTASVAYTANNGDPVTVSANLAGTVGLTASGAGTLTLSSPNNAYSGGTTIGAGGNASVIRAAATQALGSGPITFDSTGNASAARLEVAGGISLNNAITLSGRNNASVAIENISGNNTLFGGITMIVGGAIYEIQSDAGNLVLGSAGNTAITSTGSKILTLQGAGNGQVVGNIANGTGTVSVNAAGPGTWTLSGANVYTGPTVVSNGILNINGSLAAGSAVTVAGGALGGVGTINGPVTVNPGASLTPGTGSIGTLTINGALVLNSGCTNTFRISNSTSTYDSIAAGGSVTYGGVLNLIPSGAFTAGQTYTLFSGAGAINPGNFSGIQVGTSGGVTFSFTNGVLSVVTGSSHLTNSVTGGGSTLSLSWGSGGRLQMQTNRLSGGLSTNWIYLTDGTSTSTNIILSPAKPAVFYRLVFP